MRKLITTITAVFALAIQVAAQPCGANQNRYSDQPIFSAISIIEVVNQQYGSADDFDGITQPLLFDVYSPPQSDPLNKRPLIVLVHGGGFTRGDKADMAGLCRLYARRGFVAISINYRLDPLVTGDECLRSPQQRNDARYRAIQDVHAALRYFTAYASQMRVNPNWLFVGGSSAGAIAVLNTAYASQAELNLADPTIETRLGKVDRSGNPLTNTFVIRGIHNDWGAVIDQNFIQAGEGIPTISFHGLQDDIVPANCGAPLGCANYGVNCGSVVIHSILTQQGVCSELNTKANGLHGIYQDAAGKEYRVSRACCFFKGVMQCFSNTCQLNVWNTTQVPIDCSPNAVRLASEETPVNIDFYPNPATTSLTIRQYATTDEISIGIFDLSGREIVAVKNQYVVDISALSAGVYVLHITRNGRLATSLFVKE